MNNLWGLWEYKYRKDAVASDYADCKNILYYVVNKVTSFNLYSKTKTILYLIMKIFRLYVDGSYNIIAFCFDV